MTVDGDGDWPYDDHGDLGISVNAEGEVTVTGRVHLPPPLLVTCEGSNHFARLVSQNGGTCAMCGQRVTCRDDGTAWPHDRNDILAMLERGDFK